MASFKSWVACVFCLKFKKKTCKNLFEPNWWRMSGSKISNAPLGSMFWQFVIQPLRRQLYGKEQLDLSIGQDTWVLCNFPLRELGSVQFPALLHGLGIKLLCLSAALLAPAPIHSLSSSVWMLGVVLCDVCDSDGIISTSISQLRLPFPERPMAG